jgi:hypothetical protein
MIRRGFWLTAGAVTGIYGYRRVSAVGRRLSASINPAAPGVSAATGAGLVIGPGLARGAGLGRRGIIRLARESYRFSCDVRDGMELYPARHPAAAGSTLATDGAPSADRALNPELKDGH